MFEHGDLTSKTLGQYEVVERIGQGGMGIVYRGRDTVLDRDVALKVLPPAFAKNEQYLQRFMREAKSVARLDHPNIVAVYGAGEQNGVYFIAMLFVKGDLLQTVIDRVGRLDVYRALQITRQAAEALAEAHRNDIVHRDVKPQNIMINQSGMVKVMDFGLARLVQSTSGLTATGAMLGTPKYMSPEQCEGQEIDCRTDIYSLGVTLFEMLTGRLPYDADSDLGIMYQIVHKPFPELRSIRGDVPAEVSELLEMMVVKDSAQRTITAQEIAYRCECILANMTPVPLAGNPADLEAPLHRDLADHRRRLSELETIAATPTFTDSEVDELSRRMSELKPLAEATPAPPVSYGNKPAGPWGEARSVTPAAPRAAMPVKREEPAQPVAARSTTPYPATKTSPWGGSHSVSQVSAPAPDWRKPFQIAIRLTGGIVSRIVFWTVILALLFLVWVGFGHAGLYPLPAPIAQFLEGTPRTE
ncbi:MAG: hypothetical protein AMXMBFR84_30830 [Candidatus Hydrogenedentota bacterium]